MGYEVTSSIDGEVIRGRGVSLVRITSQESYPQHIHRNSDAFFYITAGTAIYCSGRTRIRVTKGDCINIQRGTPHGFELEVRETLEWISVQYPPIRDPETGEEDLVMVPLIDLI